MKIRFTFLLLLLPFTLHAAVLTGQVVGISDGDTFTLLTKDKEQIKIRVAEIDAPEDGQPYGRKSKRLLSVLIYREEIEVQVQTTDRYGRIVGRPYVNDLDVSGEMIRQGAAWAYRKYLTDKSLIALENEAREARRGVWSLPEAERIPPWEWRYGGPTDTSNATAPGTCDIKGNISGSGQRIYHTPGQRHYQATKITESKGERWFCSETEARAAGWRKAKI